MRNDMFTNLHKKNKNNDSMRLHTSTLFSIPLKCFHSSHFQFQNYYHFVCFYQSVIVLCLLAGIAMQEKNVF